MLHGSKRMGAGAVVNSKPQKGHKYLRWRWPVDRQKLPNGKTKYTYDTLYIGALVPLREGTKRATSEELTNYARHSGRRGRRKQTGG